MESCIFCKIIAGDIPAKIVHRDDFCLAFEDINPQAPKHILLIPHKHITGLDKISSEEAALMGHLIHAASTIAKKIGISENGYRLVINCNSDGGQEVFHVHFHLIGGRKLRWPPG